MTVLQKIQPLYQVGGSVRDELLGLEPKDIDYATPLLPDEIEEIIKGEGYRAYLTGKRFGTLAFKQDGKLVEITTFRAETYAPGSRKPRVEFVRSIEGDLSRRDFTINAIAKREGRIIDPYLGREDIEKNILRAVGNPGDRFNEDPLRILRACRFASQLGFRIEEKTLAAAHKRAHKILEVSRERWMQELDKLLTGEYAIQGLLALRDTGVLPFILPEVAALYDYDQKSPYHQHDLFVHTGLVVDGVEREAVVRWAALLHDIGKPAARVFKESGQANYVHHEAIGAEMVYGIAKRLKWSEDRRKTVQELVRTHAEETSPLRQADKDAH
jgi:tRNA nucleotidyltransferase (CCA-adding enzyme)